MRIPNPGQIGFSLPDYLGKIVRVGLKIVGHTGEGAPLVLGLENHFPAAEFGWINTAVGWISQGIQAVKQFVLTGLVGPEVMAITPIVPAAVYPLEPGERVIVVGDAVFADASGNELARRLTSIGGNENSALRDLMGSALYDLIQKIRSTNPNEADEFVDRFFEAHWMGRIF